MDDNEDTPVPTSGEPTRKHQALLELLETVLANVLLGLHVENPKARSAHLKGVLYHWLEQAYDLGEEANADTRALIASLKATVKRLRKINRELVKRVSDDRKR